MRAPLALALALVPLIAEAAPNAPKAPPAPPPPAMGAVAKQIGPCGAKIMPLVVGNEWTYSAVAAPNPPSDQIAKISPPEPTEIHVVVKSVDKTGTAPNIDNVFTLEETTTTPAKTGAKDKDGKPSGPIVHTLTTTITCNATTKFDISPESVFFASEPGGLFGIAIDKIDRKGTTWKLAAGTIGDQKWEEDLAILWSRPATPGSDAKLSGGKLDLERVYQPAQPETVISKLGNWHAEKLGLTTTGRVTLANPGPEDKPAELPAAWVSFVWLATNVGVVQLLNPYAHMYQLTDAKLN